MLSQRHIFNLHTHLLPDDPAEEYMLNCQPGQVRTDIAACSVGLHPWDVTRDWQEQVAQAEADAALPNVWAIGECGLDTLRGPDIELQTAAFCAQAALAERMGKPVVIHCVRAFDRLLRLHKMCRPRVAWIVHGFRGKAELAKQLMAKGMLLSFGHEFNAETVRYVVTSARPFYLETDQTAGGLTDVCRRVEDALGRSHVLLCGRSHDFPCGRSRCADALHPSPLSTRTWVGRPICPDAG